MDFYRNRGYGGQGSGTIPGMGNGPSPTTSSPHSNTHPSPMMVGFSSSRTYPNQGLEKILGSYANTADHQKNNNQGYNRGYNPNGGGGGSSGSISGPSTGGHHQHGNNSNNSMGGHDHYGQNLGDGSTSLNQVGNDNQPANQTDAANAAGAAAAAAKRGSRACAACRRGKNRCEPAPNGGQACKRCQANGIQCVFEKATDRGSRGRNTSITTDGLSVEAEGRVLSLERTVQDLANGQNQIQSALQQIISMLPQNTSFSTPSSFLSQQQHDNGVLTAHIFQNSVSPPNIFDTSPNNMTSTSASAMFAQAIPPRSTSPQNTASGVERGRTRERKRPGEFPKLPGFAPPNHQFGTYGIIPLSSAPASPSHSRRSSRSSSSHSVASSSALPQDSLTAPIQALEALANAAGQAAATREGDDSHDKHVHYGDNDDGRPEKKRKRVTIDGSVHLRVRKKTKPDPTPRNPFPDVVTKGLVSEQEARELWDVFFSGCHYFVPLFDKSYDTYETFVERTPFSTNGLLAVAAKIRAGNGPLGESFQKCLEEAQGIARSTLFGPIVRKEAVMAMLILSVWSQNGWLPCGHALRGGLDMNLHRALDKLANDQAQPRSDTEERDLVVSARIWLNCYMHDHLVSLGNGKPLLLRDDSSVRHARLLLTHPMTSETDMRLIAGVELVNLRVRVVDHLSPLHGKVDSQTISFVRRMFADLQAWYREWHAIHRRKHDEESVVVKLLESELVYAQMWTVCVALRGCQWDKLPNDQRELAFQAKDAAMRCLEIFLRASNFRAHLKYATHDQLVSVAFAAVFLLKIAILYPSDISIPNLITQVAELAHLLSAECFAERYALTLRLMLSNFRRKTGVLSTVPGTPRLSGSAGAGNTLPTHPMGINGAVGELDGGLQSLLSLPQMAGDIGDIMGGDWGMEGMEGFSWPTEFSPSNLPVWLQDGNFTDLGLPVDGSDSLFLPPELANMFLPSGQNSNGTFQFSLPDSGDVGAEAW